MNTIKIGETTYKATEMGSKPLIPLTKYKTVTVEHLIDSDGCLYIKTIDQMYGTCKYFFLAESQQCNGTR